MSTYILETRPRYFPRRLFSFGSAKGNYFLKTKLWFAKLPENITDAKENQVTICAAVHLIFLNEARRRLLSVLNAKDGHAN